MTRRKIARFPAMSLKPSAKPTLDFGQAKAHVYAMCMNDRHLFAFHRVCAIAGI